MQILQPGHGAYFSQHSLRCAPDTAVWGYLPNTVTAPVLNATCTAVGLVNETQGMERDVALGCPSAAADFEVPRAVDAVKGVHCVIQQADFRTW